MSCEKHRQKMCSRTVRTSTHQVVRERRDLLDAADDDVLDALILALLEEGVVHLACANNMAADILRRDEALGVRGGQVALERRLAEHLGQVRARLGVAQERLGEEHDELKDT